MFPVATLEAEAVLEGAELVVATAVVALAMGPPGCVDGAAEVDAIGPPGLIEVEDDVDAIGPPGLIEVEEVDSIGPPGWMVESVDAATVALEVVFAAEIGPPGCKLGFGTPLPVRRVLLSVETTTGPGAVGTL